MYRFNHFFPFLILTFLLHSCDEKPGDPSTTGLKQYIGDGFVIKYPANANLDLKGANEQVLRTVTFTGESIELDLTTHQMALPAYEIIVEWHDNPDRLDAESFARQLILTGFKQDEADDSPTDYWPVNDSGEVEGRTKTVQGESAWESVFRSDDHDFHLTFLTNRDKAISVGYKKYPVGNNPIQPTWDTVYLFVLDSIRFQKD